MSLFKKYAWYGSAVVASALLAVALLLAGPVRTAKAAAPTIVDVIFDDADDVIAGSNTPQSIVVAVDVDDGDAGVKGGLTDETNVTLQTSAGFFSTNGLSSVVIACAVDALTIVPTSYVDDGVAQLVGISEGTNGGTAETAGYPNDAETEEATDTTTDDEGCLGVNDTLIVPAGFSGTITVTAITTNGVVNSDALTVSAVPVATSVTLGTPSPTQIDSAGAVGADIAVTVRDASGNAMNGEAVTITTTLGVIDQAANVCVGAAAGDDTLTSGSDASCTLTTDGTDVIELFGNGVAGTATVTATTSGGLQTTKTVTITGGTVASLAIVTYSDNDATPVTKGSILNVNSSTTGLDELIIAVRALDANGNSIVPASPNVTIKVTGPDGTVVPDLNITNAAAENLTITSTHCSVSADAGAGTCIDAIEATGGGNMAGAVAYIDIDTTTPIPTGTYTITATYGTGTTQKTATGTFVVAGAANAVTVTTAASNIDVGGSTTVTATATDAAGNPVAQGTNVTISSSSSVLLLQDAAGNTGSNVTVAADANGQVTVTALGLAAGTSQVFATSGGKTANTAITVGSGGTTPPPTGGEGTFDRPIPNVGVNTAVWNGGTVDQLSAAVAAAGGISVTVFVNGQATVLIPGAPAFVNAAFNAAFPSGTVPAGTIVLVVK